MERLAPVIRYGDGVLMLFVMSVNVYAAKSDQWQVADQPMHFLLLEKNIHMMIADKPTVTYIFNYTYQGNKYEVTIKPGDKFALDYDWYGPLKMPILFDNLKRLPKFLRLLAVFLIA